jgi:O-antigen ligase
MNSTRSKAVSTYKWAFYLLLLLMPFSYGWPIATPVTPGVISVFVTPYLYVTDVALVIVLASGLPLLRRKNKSVARVTYPLFGLLLLAAVTAPFARAPGLAGYYVLRWSLCFLLFFQLSYAAPNPAATTKILVLGLVFQTVIGTIQYLLRGPIGLPAELALPAEAGGAAIVETLSGRILRAYGFAFHPNVLGGFLLTGLLLLLPLVRRWQYRIAWWVILLGLVLTFSRSAWLAALLTLVPTAIWVGVRWREIREAILILLMGTTLICLVSVLVFAAPLRTRFLLTRMETEQASITTRLSMYEVGIDLVRQNRFFGIGPGMFALEVSQIETRLNPEPVHNVPLLLMVELSVFGGILWCLAYLVLGHQFLKLRPFATPWPIVGFAACIALGVIGLFDFYPVGLEAGRLLTFTTFGVTVGMMNKESA